MQNIPKCESMIANSLFKASLITLSVFIVSCKSSVTKVPKSTNMVEDIGYIMSTETTNNDYFENEIFYFIPAKEIDLSRPMVSFKERNLKQGYGFYFYRRYYIQLVNSMGYDLFANGIKWYNRKESNFNIEFRRCLPVKIKFIYKTTYLSDLVQKGYIQIYDGRKFSFPFTMVDEIEIEKLDILMPKEDDLLGN